MVNDRPDGFGSGMGNESVGFLSQLGYLTSTSTSLTIPAGDTDSLVLPNTYPTRLYLVHGVVVSQKDGTVFRVTPFNDLFDYHVMSVSRLCEYRFPPGAHCVIGENEQFGVEVANDDSSQRVYSVSILYSVFPVPSGWVRRPRANFSVSDSTPAVGQTVTFTDSSLYNPTSWYWEFGDGSVSNLQNPTHVYAAAGSYSAYLVVRNAAGWTNKAVAITVS